MRLRLEVSVALLWNVLTRNEGLLLYVALLALLLCHLIIRPISAGSQGKQSA